ncbi:MAG: DinB family protein [Chloroflexi bacterium]|nr:DinB family protein [Chloroflexota bacterium]
MQLSQMFAHWAQIRADLLATIDKFSEAELTYAPYPGAWPVGKAMLHIADCEYYWLHVVVQPNRDPEFVYEFVEQPTKATIRQTLDQTHQRTLALLERLDEHNLADNCQSPRGEHFTVGWVIWHVLEHEIHHRGELSMALGLLGREGLDV